MSFSRKMKFPLIQFIGLCLSNNSRNNLVSSRQSPIQRDQYLKELVALYWAQSFKQCGPVLATTSAFDKEKVNRKNSRSGIILVVVLWILAILSLLAVGLGRRTGVDLVLSKYTIGKLKANSAAWAGFVYAIDQIKKDSEDSTSREWDTLYQCAVKLEKGKTPEDIFKNIPIGEGDFDIDYQSYDLKGSQKRVDYGLQDEERKININAITPQNYKILSHLISLLGFDGETTEIIASSVVDWADQDSAETNAPFGAEDSKYMASSNPHHCKNLPFDSLEELLFVKGMTREIFKKAKEYLTVFPRETTALAVNVNTAREIVVRALARSMAGAITNTEMADADSMADKLVTYRRGPDNQEFTFDDRLVEMNDLGLNAKEVVIFLACKGFMTDISHYLRIKVRGTDQLSGVHSDIEAVILRNDYSILYWHRD